MALAVAALVTVVHWPALQANSLLRDDHEYLVANPLVRSPGWASAARFLSEVRAPSTVKGYYQPLSMISLMLDAGLGGGPEDLRPFRRTSLGLHALNSALAVVAFRLLLGNLWIAGLAGALFGLHPLTVESVAWLSDRKTVLATCFALASLCLYLKHARRRSPFALSASAATFGLALLSKPTVIGLPLLMLLLDAWPLRRAGRAALFEKTPFLALAVISAVVTFLSQRATSGVTLPAEAPFPVGLQVAHNVVFYLRQIAWPWGQTPFYEFPPRPWLSHPDVLAGLIGAPLLVIVAAVSLRWTRVVAVGLGFFLVAVFPTLGVVGFTDVVAADRFAYFPMLGALLIVGAALQALWPRKAARGVALGLAMLALASESYATRDYLGTWRDSETLNRRAAERAPNSPEPQYNLGLVFAERGKNDAALAAYRRAIALKPDYAAAYSNMGSLLRTMGRSAEAVEALETAARIGRPDAVTLNSLANALREQRRLPEAVARLEEAVKLDPEYATAHNTLAGMLVSMNRAAEGIEHYRAAIRLAPRDARVRMNLALTLAQTRQIDPALTELDEVLRIEPALPQAHYVRARLLEDAGRRDEAIAAYRRTLELQPTNAEAGARLQALIAGRKP